MSTFLKARPIAKSFVRELTHFPGNVLHLAVFRNETKVLWSSHFFRAVLVVKNFIFFLSLTVFKPVGCFISDHVYSVENRN